MIVYGLFLDDTPFYIGICNTTKKRTLQTRLYEHIYSATHPNKHQQLQRIISGCPTDRKSVV